jgi:TolA-binding protein
LAERLEAAYPESDLRAAARLTRGRAVLSAGNAVEAVGLLQSTLSELHPDGATAQAVRYYLGLSYKAAGMTAEAEKVLSELASIPDAAFATDALYLVGQEHFDAGRYREAAESLEKYLKDRPNSPARDHALARLALSKDELGDVDAADSTLRSLEEGYPASKLAELIRVRLGEHANTRKEWERAIKLMSPVAADGKGVEASRALAGIGWAQLQKGEAESALATFTKLRQVVMPDDPMDVEAIYLTGVSLERLDRADEALAAYAEVSKKHPDSKQGPASMLSRARILVASDRATEAAEAYRGYLESCLGREGSEQAEVVLSELGWALLDAGDTAGSDEAFRRIVEEYPQSRQAAEARLNLAESNFRAGNFEVVESVLEPVVNASESGTPIEPRILQAALYRLGRAQAERKKWSAAGRTFERLTADYPDGLYPREARFWAAESAYQEGDGAKAEAGFAALANGAGNAETWMTTARLRLIQSLVLMKRWDDVIEKAAVLKAESPSHPQTAEIEFALGQALQSVARFDEAREALQRAIELRKGSELAAQAQFLRGETFFHEREYKAALREFLKVDVLYDSPKWQSLALLEAGKVYERLEQWSDAAQAYEQAYEKLKSNFPNEPITEEAEKRLATARLKSDGARREE